MEAKRILLGKSFLLFLLLILVLNVWFFVYQNTQFTDDFRTYGNIYHKTVEEMSSLTFEEGLKKSIDYQDEALQQLIDGSWGDTEEEMCRLTAMEQMETQFTHLLGYKDYLEKVQTNAEQLQSVSLFSKPGTFAYENTVKTAKDFAAMQNVEVTFGHDLAVTEVFSDWWTDFCVLLPIFLVCGCFLAERKEGLWSMIHAAPGGRIRLAAGRAGILFAASFISVFILIGTRILLCGYVYHGFEEWGRTLQSIPDFYNVPTPMTVGEFFLRYLTVKIFGVFFVGLVLWFILSCISNISLALCAAGIFAGIEFACTVIPSSSIFAPFRYINVFSYISYLDVFARYLNLSFFSLIISGHDLVMVLLPFLCAAFIVLNLLIAQKKYPVAAANIFLRFGDKLRKKLSGISGRGGIFLQETKKLLIDRKGILLLILLAFFLTKTGYPIRDGSPLDMYLEYYQEKYAGPITEETIEALQGELENAQESDRISALERMISSAEKAPEGSWILLNAPYEAVFKNQQYHRTSGLIALLFLILLIAPIMSQEHQANMHTLLHSTLAGRAKLWRRKQLLLLLCTILSFVMVYSTELMKTAWLYGDFSCFSAPVSSLDIFAFSELNMTVGGAMATLYGRRLLVLLCSAEVCFFLSELCRKNTNAILLGCGLLIFPAALAAIGSGVGEILSFLMPVAQADIFPSLFPFAVLMVLGVASAVFTLKKAQK